MMVTARTYCTTLLLSLGMYSGVYGQTLTNQSNFFIPVGLEVHLDGDFVNEGFIQNQGSLFVSGNWKNSNVYQGIGNVILDGSVVQSFYNNKNAVNHLTVNGAGQKNMLDLVPVTSRLDLLLGVVNVTDSDTLLLAQTATIGGGSPASYVEGAMTYAGSGYKFFPIGKNGNYYPVEMLDITGITPMTEIEVFENLPSVIFPPDVNPFSTVYWQRKNIRGTFISSPLSLGYQIPDDYTNRHVIDILQSDALDLGFSVLGTSRVEYGNVIDKVITDAAATGSIYVVGESIPVDGISGEFYFSTSLSPHASDPDNRVVKVFGNQLVENDFLFVVYNRWGLLVYETNSLKEMLAKGWDGTQKGERLPSGAYPFVLKAMSRAGNVIEKRGVISIVN